MEVIGRQVDWANRSARVPRLERDHHLPDRQLHVTFAIHRLVWIPGIRIVLSVRIEPNLPLAGLGRPAFSAASGWPFAPRPARLLGQAARNIGIFKQFDAVARHPRLPYSWQPAEKSQLMHRLAWAKSPPRRAIFFAESSQTGVVSSRERKPHMDSIQPDAQF